MIILNAFVAFTGFVATGSIRVSQSYLVPVSPTNCKALATYITSVAVDFDPVAARHIRIFSHDRSKQYSVVLVPLMKMR